jgi:hypothetical protein
MGKEGIKAAVVSEQATRQSGKKLKSKFDEYSVIVSEGDTSYQRSSTTPGKSYFYSTELEKGQKGDKIVGKRDRLIKKIEEKSGFKPKGG